MKPVHLFCFMVCLFFLRSGYSFVEFSSIDDVLKAHQKNHDKIKRRYHKNIDSLFTLEEKNSLESHNCVMLVDQLLVHEAIKLHTVEDLIAFTEAIQESGFSFQNLENNIEKYLKKGIPIFGALEKAIERQKEITWQYQELNKIRHNNNFMDSINKLKLHPDEHDRIRRIYALCINSWRDENNRSNRLRPKFCEPTDNYKKPIYRKHPAQVRTTYSRHRSDKTIAYELLVEEAQQIVQDQGLSVAERIVMAKCVAEKSLEFFTPVKSPRKSLIKLHHAHTYSKEKAFFSRTGVCLNFSGIAYNFARDVGMQNHVHLAEYHLHSYLEVKIDKQWYHVHPFNSEKKGCDLTLFGDVQ